MNKYWLSLSSLFFFTYFSLPLIKFFGINLKILFSLGIFLYIVIQDLRGFDYTLGKLFKSFYFKAILIMAIYHVIFMWFTNDIIPIDEFIKTYILPLIYYCSACLFLTKLGYHSFFKSVVIGILPSIIFAVGQYVGIDIFWKIKLLIDATFAPEFVSLNSSMAKASGLALFSIQLSYDFLCFIIIMMIGIYLKSRNVAISYLLFFMFLALVTSSRSTILAVFSLFIFLDIGRYRLQKLSIFLLAGWFFLVFLAFKFDIESVTNVSSAGRSFLAKTGFEIFKANPLGYFGNYFDAVEAVMKYTDFTIHESVPLDWNMRYTSHNALINMAVKYGFLGVILTVWLLVFYMRKLSRLGMTGIYFIAFVPWLVHLLFHNAGYLYNDYNFIFILVILDYFISEQRLDNPANKYIVSSGGEVQISKGI